MSMRLFFVLLTLGGSVYLLFREQGDRRLAIGALAASSIGFLLQLNVITLRLQYARSLIWTREGSKNGATVAAAMAFVSTLTVALSLRLLR